MTLVEFLLARIAEDEDHLVEIEKIDGAYGYAGMYIERTRAECAVKRRLIEQYGDLVEEGQYFIDFGGQNPGNNVENAVYVLLALAAPYADHVDYLDEWKPKA